jgi:hypothetical protein
VVLVDRAVLAEVAPVAVAVAVAGSPQELEEALLRAVPVVQALDLQVGFPEAAWPAVLVLVPPVGVLAGPVAPEVAVPEGS